jgi:Matrixin
MHRIRLATTALITLLVAVPTAAGATNHTTRNPSPVALASSIAARFWGTVPCDGRIKVLTQQLVPSTVAQRDADAWVTFNSSSGANNLAAPTASYSSCTVHLGRYRWPTTSSMIEDWDMLCMTMTHEIGHLLGHPHNTAPGNVMNPVFTNYRSEPQLCRTDRPIGSGPPP